MDNIQNAPAPPLGRMMAFIDGENLLFRYQEMLKKGMIPRDDIVGYRRKAGQFKPVDPSLPARKPIKIGHPIRSLFCGVSRLKPVAILCTKKRLLCGVKTQFAPFGML